MVAGSGWAPSLATGATGGILVGSVVWAVMLFAGNQSAPDVEPSGSGKVVARLGEPCALVDEALLEKSYGKGASEPAETSDPETSTECEWSTTSVSVHVEAEVEDYPEGAEAGGAAQQFRADRETAEEADPAGTGLPENLPGLGDEAYLVYVPKGDEGWPAEESVGVRVRRGNVLLTVTLAAAAGDHPSGPAELTRDARRIATAAVSRLP